MRHFSGGWFKSAVVALAGFTVSSALASFEVEHPGARALGMGGAFSAVADDPSAFFYNPAGLSQIRLSVAGMEYNRSWAALERDGVAETRLAAVTPLEGWGTLGLSWWQLNLSNVYQENLIHAGFGFPLDADGAFLLGGSLKFLQLAYLDPEAVAQNPYFSGGSSAGGLGIDLGALIRILPQWSAGIHLENINQPRVALLADQAPVPAGIRLGTAWRAAAGNLALDLRLQSDQYRVAGGGEMWWLNQTIATRCGAALGDHGLREATCGFSFRFANEDWGGQLDYALLYPWGDFSGGGLSHTFNLSFDFGRPGPKKAVLDSFPPSRMPSETGATATPLPSSNNNRAAKSSAVEPVLFSRPAIQEFSEPEMSTPENKSKKRPAARAFRTSKFKAAEGLAPGLPDSTQGKNAEVEGKEPLRTEVRVPRGGVPTPGVANTAAHHGDVKRAGESKTDSQDRKLARGAYGRTVKLMLDIEKLKGAELFPEEYARCKAGLNGVKLLLQKEKYRETISAAEQQFPVLEGLKTKCTEQEKARKAMPTKW